MPPMLTGVGESMTNEAEIQENPDDTAIDNLFEDETEETEAETESVETEVTEDSQGEDEPEAQAEGESTEPPAVKEPTLVPIAALQDERRKAQLFKEEVEKLRQQIPKSEEAPDPYDDLDAYNAWNRQQWEQEQISAQSARFAETVELSRSRMLETHDDYKKIEEVFYTLATMNPDLKQEMFDSKDPAQFAYETGKAYVKAQIESFLPVGTPAPKKEPKPLINAPNLATASAQGSNSTKVEVDADLDDMFDDQKY